MSRSEKRQSVAVELGGQRFQVVSDASPERIAEVVSFVNERLSELQSGKRGLDPERAALLVALNAAEELYAERDRHEGLRQTVRSRAGKLLGTLDEVGRDLGLDPEGLTEGLTEVPVS